MTFSIVARCAETGMLGVAVTSSSPAVAARCAFAQAGTGAVATQNVTDPSLGPRAIKLLAAEACAEEAIDTLIDSAQHIEYRQLLVIDKKGKTAVYSGDKTLGTWATATGRDCAAGGNLLANEDVPKAMIRAFEASAGSGLHLGERILDAMRAGRDAGGEAGPVHSAGIKVVDTVSWPVADLRIDWTDGCPLDALQGLWEVYKPQMNDYVQRALDPAAAPSYGVPGDE